MSKIHVFGDSHTLLFSELPYCEVNHLGPITMHRVGRDGFYSLIAKDKIETVKKSSSNFIFSFGEIDIRGHVGKQVLKGLNEDEVISDLVDRYMSSLSALEYDNIMIYNIIPPPSHMDSMVFKKAYPMVGTKEKILGYNVDINKRLRDECDCRGLHFVDIRDNIVNEDGFLDTNKSDGGIHVHPQYYHILGKVLIKKMLGGI